MKAYTDLEQSKKLAEILPAESADMCWGIDDDTLMYNQCPYPLPYIQYTAKEFYLPCWSLAALLGVIKPINENTYTIIGTLDGGAIISFDEITNVMFQEEEIIDAVFEMVIWLKENGKI